MIDRRDSMRRSLSTLGLTATVILSGCVDTELQGVVREEDIRSEENMLPLVRGINSELTDNWYDFDGSWWVTGAATDEFNNDGVSTSEERLTRADYRDRPGSFVWEQAHEAAWSAYYGVSLLEDVFGEDAANRSPLTAQTWWNAGMAERLLGEAFCEVVYDYGPYAGHLIGPNDEYDATRAVPQDSAFKRSIYAYERTLAIALDALDAGVPASDDDPIFDPRFLVYKAHAGIAQSAMLLGEWERAVEHAAQVPDDFIAYSHMDPETETNRWHETSFQNDDFTLWNTPVHTQFRDDPRVPWVKCGEFIDGERNVHGPAEEIIDTDECERATPYGGEFRAESNSIPLYASLKSEEEGLLVRIGGETGEDADHPLAKGTEMRLIRAEYALRNGDLVEFTNQVNAARAVYGLAPIAEPSEAGELEYPNAEDDAWSILDRERYLTLHLEGRRLADFHRWQHPYATEGHLTNTRVLEESGPRTDATCMPLPDLECDTNSDLPCPNLAAGG